MHYVERLFQSLQPLYNESWFPWVVGAIGILFAYSVFKSLKALPRMVMYPIIGATCVIVFFTWLYNRNEPAILSPLMDILAHWFPSKGSVSGKKF